MSEANEVWVMFWQKGKRFTHTPGENYSTFGMRYGGIYDSPESAWNQVVNDSSPFVDVVKTTAYVNDSNIVIISASQHDYFTNEVTLHSWIFREEIPRHVELSQT